MQTFLIANKPNLAIADGVLSVKAKTSEYSCVLGQVEYYDFPSDVNAVGIQKLMDDNGIKITDGQIIYSGLNGNDEIAVFTIDGKNVVTVNADSQGNAIISLSQLPKGVFIVKAGNISTKIINK